MPLKQARRDGCPYCRPALIGALPLTGALSLPLSQPIFWVKMLLLAVMGAASFFPTTKIIQRSVAKRQGETVPPMSPKLIKRITSIVNAELLAVASIPLAATLMARGVGYVEGL